MEVHANAPLSPIGRGRVVDRVVRESWSVAAAAEAAGVTERTVYRWLARWRVEGPAGLLDRRSVPKRIPHKTPPDPGRGDLPAAPGPLDRGGDRRGDEDAAVDGLGGAVARG